MYGNGLVEVWGVSMVHKTVMLTEQRSLPRAIDSPKDSRTVLHHAVG